MAKAAEASTPCLTRRCALHRLGMAALLPQAAHAKNAPLILAGHPEFAPFSYRSAGGLAGILPDMASLLGERAGLRFQTSDLGPWARVLAQAKQGQIDLLAGAYISEERKAFLDFMTPALAPNEVVVVVRRGEAFAFKEWRDLLGRTLGRVHGDSYMPEFETFLNDNAARLPTDAAPSPELNLRKLLRGRVDLLVYSRWVTLHLARQLGLQDQIELLPVPVFTGQLHLALPRNSPAAKTQRSAIQRELEALVSDTATVRKIVRRHVPEA